MIPADDDGLFPLSPTDKAAIARNDIAVMVAGFLLQNNFPLRANGGTGVITTEYSGHPIRIHVSVPRKR